MENAFGILKETWREFLGKIELNIVYLPYIITACAILHNMLRRQADEDLEAMGAMMDNNGPDDVDGYLDGEVYDACDDLLPQMTIRNHGESLRRSLGTYLGSQSGVGP